MDEPDLADLILGQRAFYSSMKVTAPPAPGTVAPHILRQRRLYRPDGTYRPAKAAEARDNAIKTSLGEVKTREFPAEGSGVIAHLHGGGWCLGSIYEQDIFLADIAARTGVSVVSIDYPLAPETSLPQAIEVTEASLRVLFEHRPGPAAVIGESAGAHLGLACALRLRRWPELMARIGGMSLSYGIYDLSMTPSQRSWGDRFWGLSTPWLEWFYALALPQHTRDQRSDPALSPLYADLAGLPPTLFSVGEADPLLDDSLFLFQRWLTAGNAGRLDLYPEAPHGFNHAPTAMAVRCNDRVVAFLKAALD